MMGKANRTKSTLPIQYVEQICDLMEERGLSEVEVSQGEISIRVRRDIPSATANRIINQELVLPLNIEESGDSNLKSSEVTAEDSILSPMPGIFYCAPSPEDSPFVQVGDTVSIGDTICLIEAMKIFNEVKAEVDCEILEILGSNGEPVEFDQPLFRIKKI